MLLVKKTIFSLILYFTIFFSNSFAQIIQVVPIKPSPTLGDYEFFLDMFKTDLKIFQKSQLQKIKLIDKKTSELFSLGSFSNLEQKAFILDFAEIRTKHMFSLQTIWQSELKKFSDPNYVPLKNIEIKNKLQEPASKEDVKKYINVLQELRYEFFVQFEKFIEDNEDVIPIMEYNIYVVEIKRMHERMNLKKKD